MPQPSPARTSYHHGNLRSALVDVGLELTRTGGTSALALRDVARHAGVSASATYRHFADRESLLAAVAGRIQDLMAEQMRLDATRRTPRERLRAVGLGYIAFALQEPGWFDVAFSDLTAVPGTGGVPRPLAALVDALDGLVAEGSLSEADRAGAEWPCWSAVHGFALLALRGPLRALPRDDVRTAAERTVEAIIAGLLAEEGSLRLSAIRSLVPGSPSSGEPGMV
jgi:AcrR family transcriptional regulator